LDSEHEDTYFPPNKNPDSEYMKPPTKEYLPPKLGPADKHVPHEENKLFSHGNVDIRSFSKEYLASGMLN
jgi:hypothetical protein